MALTDPDKYGDFIALAITSVETQENALIVNQDQLQEGILPKTSWIRTDKIFTLSSDLVVKRFGIIKQEMMDKTLIQLCEFITHKADKKKRSHSQD